jgi:hypothetical protein
MADFDGHALAWTVFLVASGVKAWKLARLIRGHGARSQGQLERFRRQLERNWSIRSHGAEI